MLIKGLYIEDDDKNIFVIKALFEQEGFEIVTLPQLPKKVEDIYPLVLEQQVDFLLVDHELNKKVGYSGFDALREIRKCDSTIYAILLTNFQVEDFKTEFDSYDLELHKSELSDENKLREISSKIRRACARSVDLKTLVQVEENCKREKEELELLKEIYKRVTETT